MSRTAYGSRITSCVPGARSRGFWAAVAFSMASRPQPATSSFPKSSDSRWAKAEPASPSAASSTSLVVAGAYAHTPSEFAIASSCTFVDT